jgi:DNA-binding MurR/RpiR family transcriptional regulator
VAFVTDLEVILVMTATANRQSKRMSFDTFDNRVALHFDAMSPAERRVLRVLSEAREDVLIASAASLAAKAGTSDATVVRTVKSLGFKGMDEFRRLLAQEMKQGTTIANRLTGTLREVGDDPHAALHTTLDIHRDAIESLRRDITPELFRAAVQLLSSASRVVIFGIGPSHALATYFATQLGRFGITVLCLSNTGLLFAVDLRKLRSGDVLLAMAYTHIYPELDALLNEADRLRIKKLLLTDSLAARLRRRVNLVLPVARGRAKMLSMHTATLGLMEALLVGIAAQNPREAIRNLEALNILRKKVVGKSIDIPSRSKEGSPRSAR